MITKLTVTDAFQKLCKSAKKWGVYIELSHISAQEPEDAYTDYFDEILKAAPYLSITHDTQILVDGKCMILTDSEKEMDEIYNSTVGDDGPTKTNPYNGKARVYALTCDNHGQLRNENK
jgi:hypothetical protein